MSIYKMKQRLFTYLVLMLSGLVGCADEFEQNLGTETGTVILDVSATAVSKAVSSDVLDSDEDKMIKTLIVWLVQDGTVTAIHTSTPDASSETVTFNNVLRGDYKLYIVANYDNGLATAYPKGSNTLTGLQEYVLGEVPDGMSPSYSSTNGVPASLVMDISVAPGNNEISAHLKRVVGRLSVAFRNMTEHDLYVGDMSLSDYNPSRGYLFSQNHSLPGSSVYHGFPSLGGEPVKVGNETIVFDHYLYETGYPASPFELSFDAGLYINGTSPTYTETSVENVSINVGTNTTTSPGAGELFMIHSYNSPMFYVGADDSGLICTEFDTDANINNSTVADNFIWECLGDGSLRNMATGKYLSADYDNLKPTMSGTPSKITITKFTDTFAINVSTKATFIYMALNATNTGVVGSSSVYSWYLRSVSRDVATETKKAFTGDKTSFLARMEKSQTHEMIYLDSYGIAQPLTHICRNEHIKLTVNVSYHQSTGGFDVSVSGWTEKSNETTFD